MNKGMRTISPFLLYITFFLLSCVSPKIHNALSDKHQKTTQDLQKVQQELLNLSDKIEEINFLKKNLLSKINKLKNDSIQNGTSIKLLQSKYDELNRTL